MKTRRFCPGCGRPLWKSKNKLFDFQCYNCDKDYSKEEVLRKKDLSHIKQLRNNSCLDDLWRKEYPHSHKKPYPRKRKGYIRNKTQGNKYTTESLIAINGSYDHEHIVMPSDVEMANRYVQIIESTRSDKQPRNGDTVRLTTKHGDYYPYAHLEKLYDHGFSVCERPYVPFIWPDSSKNGISCSTSGGAWLSIPPKAMKYIGKEEKMFHDWGWCGACGNGAVKFEAEVSVWEYIEPDAIYDNYSTKDWRKIHLSKNTEEYNKKDDYLYCGNGILFRSQEELDEYIEIFKGKLYTVYWPNSYVLWCYFEEKIKLSLTDWEALQLPETTLRRKNNPRVKIGTDDINHTVTLYSIL